MKNRVTEDDLLKLSEAALQRQLPLLKEFQTGRVTVTHQAIETKTLCKCSGKKKMLFDILTVEVSEIVDTQKTLRYSLNIPVESQ